MPVSTLVLGFLLGPMFEQALRQSIAMAGTPMVFIERPIPLALVIATALVLIVTTYLKRRSRAVANLIRESTNEA